MPDEEIEANIITIISTLCQQRNPALGPFINRAALMTLPGKTFYSINVNEWLPVPTEVEIRKVSFKNFFSCKEVEIRIILKTFKIVLFFN